MPKRSTTPGPRDERGVLAGRIVAAARVEFAEHGWAGTTIRAIARAADVDPALVYHYFGSKEKLLDAATNPPQKWLDDVAKVCRMACNVGPISSSSQLASISSSTAAPSCSTGVTQTLATSSSHFCGGFVAASSSFSLDP
ncbi:helix-turn-helix domain-containing protein, partial [Mycobacterium sp. 1482292.6]|uniref:helix-turn-helix domain-containing protein n=1 Tax=Mycobacterium sp. 1482292.6 TaxID=1834081 RepID=UPI001E335882